MSESNKTKLPTEKRLQKAREDGNFCFSDSIVHVLTLLAGVSLCYFALADLPQVFDKTLHQAIVMGSVTDSREFASQAQNTIFTMVVSFLPTAAMFFCATALFGYVGNIIQVGFVFQGSKFTKGKDAVNPVTNIKNIFSMHMFSNFCMQILKTVIVCWICYHVIKNDVTLTDRIYGHRLDVLGGLLEVAHTAGRVLLIAFISLVPLCALDYLVKKKLYIKDNMMGDDEIEREHKESEGDPHMKAQRKAIGQELAGIASPEEDRVQNASAIIRNPTHVAIVVRFEPHVAPVPYIIDIKEGDAAFKLIEDSKKYDIPLYENIPLARGLLLDGRINEHIPVHYAEQVVPFIYWLQNNHPNRVFYTSEFAGTTTRIGDVKR